MGACTGQNPHLEKLVTVREPRPGVHALIEDMPWDLGSSSTTIASEQAVRELRFRCVYRDVDDRAHVASFSKVASRSLPGSEKNCPFASLFSRMKVLLPWNDGSGSGGGFGNENGKHVAQWRQPI